MSTRGKPDMETESFRVWFEKETDFEHVNAPSITIDDMEFKLIGFNVAWRNKEKTDPVFAYKFSRKEKMIIYHSWAVTDEEKAKIEQLMGFINATAPHLGYHLMPVVETLKNIVAEKKSILKRSELKERKNDS